jgi:transposase
MNAFYQHHQDNISFHYSCFDRMLLNATIQPFQQPERVMGFFWSYRQLYPVSRQVLRDIAAQYHNWGQSCARKSGAPILDAPEEERREQFVTPYYRGAQPDQIVAILKAREPARILVSIGKSATEQGHLLYKRRWVDQYNFYIHDRAWGRMFVRICPYFPFPARVYFNQHYWLAQRLGERGIRFLQCANAFLRCRDPQAASATRRFARTPGHRPLRSEMAHLLSPLLYRPRATRGRRSTPSVLRPGRIL